MNKDTVIDLLNNAGLVVEVVYDGPAGHCPSCKGKELTAAA